MQFTIYDPVTGEVHGIGDVPDETLALAHEKDGLKVLIGQAVNALTHRVNPVTKRANKRSDRPRYVALQDIAFERERRLSVGFDYDFKDARGVHHIGVSDHDWFGWQEVHAKASKAMLRGRPETLLDIVTDTGSVQVTAAEWLDVLDAIEKRRQPIVLGAFALRAKTKIPDNVRDDNHWKVKS